MDKLKQYLKREGISQYELSKRIGVSRQSINRWINGRKKPDPGSALKIQEATNGEILAREICPEIIELAAEVAAPYKGKDDA